MHECIESTSRNTYPKNKTTVQLRQRRGTWNEPQTTDPLQTLPTSLSALLVPIFVEEGKWTWCIFHEPQDRAASAIPVGSLNAESPGENGSGLERSARTRAPYRNNSLRHEPCIKQDPCTLGVAPSMHHVV